MRAKITVNVDVGSDTLGEHCDALSLVVTREFEPRGAESQRQLLRRALEETLRQLTTPVGEEK